MGRLGCLIIGAVIIVAIGLVLGLGLPKWLGGGVNLSSPKHTVNSFLDAMQDQDASRVADCWNLTEEERGDFIALWDGFFGTIDSIEITDINKTGIPEADTKTEVNGTADYHIKIVGPESEIDTDSTDYFQLVKKDGNWYIDDWLPGWIWVT